MWLKITPIIMFFVLFAGLNHDVATIIAQTPPINFNFDIITKDDGIVDDRYNNYIFKDSDGFVWISSLSGINRFDGNQLKHYGTTDGMIGKNVQSTFFEDCQKRIWFSTYRGLQYYSKQSDSIYQVPICSENGELVKNRFKVFHFDSYYERIWLKVGDRIVTVDLDDFAKQKWLTGSYQGFDYQVSTDTLARLRQILIAPWWNGAGVELLQIDNTTVVQYQHLLPELSYIPQVKYFAPKEWVVVTPQTLALINDGRVSHLISHTQYRFSDAIFIENQTAIVATKKNGLLIGQLARKDTSNRLQVIKKVDNIPFRNPDHLYVSPDQYLWYSEHKKGVCYSYLYHNEFANPLEENKLPAGEVTSILEDNNGHIWVSTGNGKLYVFDSTGQFIREEKVPSSVSIIWQIAKDIEGTIFVATNNGVYFHRNQRLQLVKKSINYTFRYIKAIAEGRRLVSTNQGIKEITKIANGYQLEPCSDLAEYNDFDFLTIFQSADRSIYLPYNWEELWQLKMEQEKLVIKDKIAYDFEFYTFCESQQQSNTIWLGTSNGLKKMTGTEINAVINNATQLNNINVYNIVEDQDGMLWLGTNNGLWRYDPFNEKTHQFEIEDGLVSNLFFQQKCALLASNGQIWLGTSKGLVKFDPTTIRPYAVSPKVYIDELRMNDETPYKGIGEKNHIDLTHDQNTLLFNIPAIGYYKAKRSKINYQLQNYDEEWLKVNNGQAIRFTKLPFGEYTLRVQAEDANGNQSSIKELHISIHPPWWRTWWFYALCSTLFLGAIYALYQYRIAQIKRREAKKTAVAQLEVQALENELKALRSQMNPHFLFNTMNAIKGIIIKQDTRQAIKYLTKLSVLIRAILANSEQKVISLQKELETLTWYIELEALRFFGKFYYKIQIDPAVDTNFINVPPLVLQPFVENAIWHGLLPKQQEDKQLIIRILQHQDWLLCEIEDNGIGRTAAQRLTKSRQHQSMGINITQKRIQLQHAENQISIVDLIDEKQQPLGTKVIIKLFAPD